MTSVPDLTSLLWLNEQIPLAMFKSTEKPSQKFEGYCNSKVGLNVEQDVQRAHIVRCPHTFGPTM